MQPNTKYLYFLLAFSILLSGCFLQKKQSLDKEEIVNTQKENKLIQTFNKEIDSLFIQAKYYHSIQKYDKSKEYVNELVTEFTDSINGGSIKGVLFDEDTKESLPFANAFVSINDIPLIGCQTNFDGEFIIENIKAGNYTFNAQYIGFKSEKVQNVVVDSNVKVNLDRLFLKEDYINIQEKPIIYLYPEEKQNIQVELNYDGELTHTYPKYKEDFGWKVEAYPDGTLYDEKGKEYYALYWEGKTTEQYTVDEGFVVKGEETIAFLEEALAILGLNRKEANEFIIYWLPKLESNAYNLIHFSSKEYEELAKLNIEPKPETLIRVMMVFQGLNEPIDIPKQDLKAIGKTRKGFTVVEWGGTELKENMNIVKKEIIKLNRDDIYLNTHRVSKTFNAKVDSLFAKVKPSRTQFDYDNWQENLKKLSAEFTDSINGASIKGILLDGESKEPLSSTNAFLFINGIPLIRSQTNSKGEFVIENIKTGIYEFRAEGLGYVLHRDFNLKIEANIIYSLDTLFLSDISEELNEKPIIYLYPETKQEISVELDYNGELTHTYPKYKEDFGWKVEAHPDGTLYDEKGKEYYALYWEGKTKEQYTIDEGFVVKGSETIEFLEDALATLGLNRKEANEFIIYWLPKLESNAYNLIHFSSKEYEELAKLNIEPKPETLIRVMMVFQGLNAPIDIPKQDLKAIGKTRKGFTVVEWGGTELIDNEKWRIEN